MISLKALFKWVVFVAVVCRFLVIEELSPLDSAEFKVIYRPPRAPVKKLNQNRKGPHWWELLGLVTVYLCLGSWCVHYQTKSRIKQEFNDVPTFSVLRVRWSWLDWSVVFPKSLERRTRCNWSVISDHEFCLTHKLFIGETAHSDQPVLLKRTVVIMFLGNKKHLRESTKIQKYDAYNVQYRDQLR